MTLDEAITLCGEIIGEKYLDGHVKCASNHEQLKKWLEELKELKNPRPYKFEELEPNMWVWDDKLKTLYKIKKIMHCHWFKAEYRSFVLDVKTEERKYHTGIMEFEEGRFFPLTKAMEYQGKAGDEK